MNDPHFVLTAVGTQGDLLPMLALARGLLDRGFETTMLGNQWAAARAEAQGIPFETIAPTYASNLGGVEECFGRYVFPSYAPTFAYFERLVRARKRVVVINWTNCAASTLMCERYDLDLCRLVPAPYYLPSLASPPQPLAARVPAGSSADEAHRILLDSYARQYRHPFVLGVINAYRRELGLPVLHSTYAMSNRVDQYIGLFPAWYSETPSDWPRELQQVGFPLPRPEGELPGAASELITQHGAPVVFVPGTGAGDNERFANMARRCCEELGSPGIVLGARHDERLDRRGRILHLERVELGLLLRRSAACVHHGGVGTTARAFEAGVPQIVSPQDFDQPDNADRVARLGAGVVLPRAQLSARSLATTVRHVLESTEIAREAKRLSRSLQGARSMCRVVECLARRFASGSSQRSDGPRSRDGAAFAASHSPSGEASRGAASAAGAHPNRRRVGAREQRAEASTGRLQPEASVARN